MSNQLSFQNTQLSTVNINNQIYLSASELAKALQYADSKSVTKIYNAHADEFTLCMTTVADSTTVKGMPYKTRFFSLRGCHLIAMFSRTKIAKDFRIWVLDRLDRESGISNVDNYDVLVRQLDRLETVHECQQKLLRIYLNDFQDFLEKLSPHTAYNISVLLNKIGVNIGLALNYASTAHPTRIVKTK